MKGYILYEIAPVITTVVQAGISSNKLTSTFVLLATSDTSPNIAIVGL